MIPTKFEYYKVDTLEEAFQTFNELSLQGKNPMYYSGGTEIITMARANNIHMSAVIDIKGIPECCTMEMKDNKLNIGSAVTLSQISESKMFPLLDKTAARIADHTVQCKLTIGGNLCGTIIYKETSLPLMLCDSIVVIFGKNGRREVQFNQIFDKKLNLLPGEILVNLIIDERYFSLPYVHVKKTKSDKIAYPLMTVAALKKDNKIRIAFSGLYSYPFRNKEIENYINDEGINHKNIIGQIIEQVSSSILNDAEGSSEYRKFVLKNTLENTFKMLNEV
ncbi:MAG: FAD binding domain-containing protein [Sedimentibacter saalensis]|uniref:FAD binding domain-containing protein n=1 Tax=Sedimentibacter saalensis TaxID=130788 RepID=UPI002B204F0E|nr:FAD binding domain-containing protein [Sedimentibacter saalensis]MEA5095279.1 FAD binding domain-containing protein [Sedimentibacter saalensis]